MVLSTKKVEQKVRRMAKRSKKQLSDIWLPYFELDDLLMTLYAEISIHKLFSLVAVFYCKTFFQAYFCWAYSMINFDKLIFVELFSNLAYTLSIFIFRVKGYWNNCSLFLSLFVFLFNRKWKIELEQLRVCVRECV